MSNRQLPTYMIEGTSFFVDVDKGLLTEVGNPHNNISFRSLNDKGDHYETYYDKEQKNLVDPVGYVSDQMVDVHIPLMRDLDPEGMRLKYGDPETYLRGMTEKQYLKSRSDLALRHQGKLPRVVIGMGTYIMDVNKQELIPDEYAREKIELRQLALSGDGTYYSGYYDNHKIGLYIDKPGATDIPEHIRAFHLPPEIAIDPVGVAKRDGLDEKEVIRNYPARHTTYARMSRLSHGQQEILAAPQKKQATKRTRPKM